MSTAREFSCEFPSKRQAGEGEIRRSAHYEAVKLNYLLGLHVQRQITVISYGVGYLTRVAGETDFPRFS